MQKITPFIWFNDNAEEAVNFYTAIFNDAAITQVTRYGAGGPGPEGSVMTIAFRLEGQSFSAINGGPMYQLTPAISLVVNCNTQEELDNYWDQLAAGSSDDGQCGWLTDKFGVTWQVVPVALFEMLQSKDAARSGRMMQALMKMKKLNIAELRKAFDQ